MNTKIKGSIIVILITFVAWYFLLKPSDYTIRFEAKTATGTIYQGVLDWAAAKTKSNTESYTSVEKRNYDFIKQELKKGDEHLVYTWTLTSVNDSTTKIVVDIKDENHSWYNKLTAPFVSTPFREKQIARVKDFKVGLDEHLKAFKVRIDGEGESTADYIAYISLTSVMQEKAQTMIANDAVITGYLFRNNIKIIGKPFIEVTNWDKDKEILQFNIVHVQFSRVLIQGVFGTNLGERSGQSLRTTCFERRYDIFHVLSTRARHDEQRVARLHDDQVIHANERDHPPRR